MLFDTSPFLVASLLLALGVFSMGLGRDLLQRDPRAAPSDDCANTTRSNDLLAGRQFSNVVFPAGIALAAAARAIRESGSTARTCAPASTNWAEAMPVPAPTSKNFKHRLRPSRR